MNNIESELQKLSQQEECLLNLALRGMQADQGKMFLFDIYTNAIVNRSIQLSSGFSSLIQKRNAVCSGALLRMQVDTTVRYSAAMLVENLKDFVIQVIDGEQINRIKDRNGKTMTDSYLVRTLSVKYPWLAEVYKRTSGYVHFSVTHIHLTHTLDKDDDSKLQIGIGGEDEEWLSDLHLEMTCAFRAITEILIDLIESWVSTKSH